MGDTYVICSDGLNDMVGDAVIKEALESGACTARRLVDEADLAGGRDNITVIVMHVAADD